MYVEIGLPAKTENESDEINIEEQLALTLKNLQKLEIIDIDNNLLSYSAIMMDPAYVHVDSDLESLKTLLKSELEMHQIYSIGRYGDWKYCSIEDSMIDALELSEKLMKQ